MQATVNLGQRFPLTIQRLGINGEGIGGYVAKFENQTRPLGTENNLGGYSH